MAGYAQIEDTDYVVHEVWCLMRTRDGREEPRRRSGSFGVFEECCNEAAWKMRFSPDAHYFVVSFHVQRTVV